ncbi:MAG: hypothetical protein ABIK28_04695 [Planctomycetota bacterium]
MVFIAAAVIGSWQQWIESWIGSINFIYLGTGFLFFYIAVLVAEKNLMRKKFIGLLEEIQGYFLGPDFREVCGAIDILIRALETGEEKAIQVASDQLKKMTGKDLGPDPAKWKTWWSENRIRFLMARNKNANTEGGEPHGLSQ